jgi:DNA-binding MarR family transcriptional regulator
VRLLVLHGLRLKGFAEAAALAALWSCDEAEVTVELKGLADDGLVQRRDGRISGWSLTAEGRTAAAVLLVEELDAAGARPAIEDAYQRFLEVNPDLLAACTAWQLTSAQTVNDHADAAYDASVIARLADVHDRAQPVLVELVATLHRFRRYPERLRNALERVQAGATEWFTKPLVDSYHTVWFELHEDLLATLGVQRGDEGR